MGDQIMPPPAFRLPSDPAEQEREIRRMLADLYEEYQTRAHPLLMQLTRIQMMKPAPAIYITADQLAEFKKWQERDDA